MRRRIRPKYSTRLRQHHPVAPVAANFQPGANLKCRYCGGETHNNLDEVQRLHDPKMIVVGGASVFSDRDPLYQVRIIEFGAGNRSCEVAGRINLLNYLFKPRSAAAHIISAIAVPITRELICLIYIACIA